MNKYFVASLHLTNLVGVSKPLNSRSTGLGPQRWPAAALCVALISDPDGWLVTLIMLGSQDSSK